MLDIGFTLAVVSTALGVGGTIINSAHYHKWAIYIWCPANILATVWAYGVCVDWWEANLGAAAMAVMYGSYIVINAWGLIPYLKEDLNI